MPLIRQSLQRAFSAKSLLQRAHIRSCSRPCCAYSATRSIRCLASSDRPQNSGNGESNSRGQGFGKAFRAASKKPKAGISNTAEALIQSLGGNGSPHTQQQHHAIASRPPRAAHGCHAAYFSCCAFWCFVQMMIVLQRCLAPLAEMLAPPIWC